MKTAQQRNAEMLRAARLIARIRLQRRAAAAPAVAELLDGAVEYLLLVIEAVEQGRDDVAAERLTSAEWAWTEAQRLQTEAA